MVVENFIHNRKIMKEILTFLLLVFCLNLLVAQDEINCDTIYTDPAESEYILPYPTGKTYNVTQSNCHPTGGHFLTFAYDFNTAIGDTIIACRAGVVTFANDQYLDTDWTSGHENNVFVKHSDGTRIRYTHLKQGGALVVANQQVEQGQAIGISGSSGNTGGFPHLHLSAFQDGTSFNRQNTIPINFCNTNDPLNAQNLLIEGQSYTAIDKSTSAAKESDLIESFSVYPNPASVELNIDLNVTTFNFKQVQLFNVNGEQVYTSNVEESLSNIKVPVNKLSKGVYFLLLRSDMGEVRKKVLIF